VSGRAWFPWIERMGKLLTKDFIFGPRCLPDQENGRGVRWTCAKGQIFRNTGFVLSNAKHSGEKIVLKVFPEVSSLISRFKISPETNHPSKERKSLEIISSKVKCKVWISHFQLLSNSKFLLLGESSIQ